MDREEPSAAVPAYDGSPADPALRYSAAGVAQASRPVALP
ncbi:hypothetical protein RR42_m1881 [Cupriavidus basilensis]|uniref:Uncharacterized protein n=1 Tax=Cupriavidus basilensis TaxID=68895 RepID=A0A0C4YER9_9BURK|nr:hypothetical protein RR42_m1881 [Cupriavidus basilensis]